MLHPDPFQRITLTQIKKHDWMRGMEIPDDFEDMCCDMNARTREPSP
jgi:hypothetical protein